MGMAEPQARATQQHRSTAAAASARPDLPVVLMLAAAKSLLAFTGGLCSIYVICIRSQHQSPQARTTHTL